MNKSVIAVACMLYVLIFAHMVSGHDGEHHNAGDDSVKVRVVDYDPINHIYNISCEIPEATPTSQIDPTRYYAIDPVPVGHEESYRTNSSTFVWDLDPEDFEEQVHTKAIYHMYCEVQNFSAPIGQQNLASEFHVDLRTDDNVDVPDIYVLDSEGTSVTLKCDPPDGVDRYGISWTVRSRAGTTSLPEFDDQQIIDVTVPEPTAGWDITCTVLDKDTGQSSTWDMPIEFFESGPAYVPTFEGCVPNEPCYHVSPDGSVPDGFFEISTTPGEVDVYINEDLQGTTDSSGELNLGAIAPGFYNLVLRKDGYEEISTLLPIKTGETFSRSYTLQLPSEEDDEPACHDTVYSLPSTCEGGEITNDDVVGGCRIVECGNSFGVKACNKPDNNDPQYFEMYRETDNPSGLTICIGDTCMQNQGFLASDAYPICLGGATPGNETNTTGAGGGNETDTNTTDPNEGDVGGGGNSTTSPGNETNTTNNETNPGNQTCHENLESMPVTCNGGSGIILEDVWNGCRTVVCSDGAGSSTQVLACDKPNWQNPDYFEMYKQTSTGNPVEVCFGDTCILNSGYAKSSPYPMCFDAQGNETPPGDGNNTVPDGNETDTNTTNPGDGNSTELPGNQTNTTNNETNQTCYEDIQELSATCDGGEITQDSWNGCRALTCTGSSSQVNFLACQKPGNFNPEFFELYRQTENPEGLTLCLGDTCISSSGYAKSGTYPICVEVPGNNTETGGEDNSTVSGGNETDTNSTSPPGNQTNANTTNNETGTNTTQSGNETAGEVCYPSVDELPSSCNGGTFTEDLWVGGCRRLVCSSGIESLQVQACNKPGNNDPQYFEMYRQTDNPGGLEICLLDTCISNSGYAKSANYPICTEAPTGGNQTNGEDNSTGNEGGGTSSLLSAPEWIEPTDGLTGVTPDYFHLATFPPNNSEEVVSSDWEVWDVPGTERLWTALGNTEPITYHTHTPDGAFENSLEGQGGLLHSTSYKTRARYMDLTGNYSLWSEWRTFTTEASSPVPNASSLDWTAAPGFRVEKFAGGFDAPVHLDFSPDLYGHLPESLRPYFYVTELYGTVKVVYRDGSSSVFADGLLNFDPFGSITGGGQMGVVGLYVDQDSGDLYVGTVYLDENESIKNKVIHFETNSDGSGFVSQNVIIDNMPSGPSHQIEQITKGPDGKLYVNLGEGLEPDNAQDDDILAGKIVRMDMDGSNVEVYAKGFRNPFGADWRPGTDQLFVTDNAPDSGDKLVRVEEGENYGWGINDPGFVTFKSRKIATLNVSPVDVEFNPGSSGFPIELDGKLYVAVGGPIYQQGPVDGKHIIEFTLDGNGNVTERRGFVWYTGDGYGTPIGLDFGPDGLYFTDIYGESGFVGLGETEANIYRVVQGEPGNCTGDCGISEEFHTGISIAPWYPKDTGTGISYVLECQGIDGSGTYSYEFDIGGGPYQVTGNTIYKEYPYGDQNYTISCYANDQITGERDGASITVNPDNFIPDFPS